MYSDFAIALIGKTTVKSVNSNGKYLQMIFGYDPSNMMKISGCLSMDGVESAVEGEFLSHFNVGDQRI